MLRLPDALYETARRYAESDSQTINSWIETLLAREDMRRHCVAHEAFLVAHPEQVRFAEAWADGNLDELSSR